MSSAANRINPLNLAHRGASAYAPENTMAAFELAFQIGADGIELDVTLSRDGVPVVIHDYTVDRTTNGQGDIRQMTSEQIKRLDAGINYPKYRGECIPTLEQALRAIGDRGIANIELKSVTIKTDGLEKAVVNVIDECQVKEQVIISSFNPFALARIKAINPLLARGLLYAPNLPIYLRRMWLRPLARPTAVHPRHDMVVDKSVRWVRSKQLKLNTWTVDEPTEMKRLIDLGVDAIITNKPDILKRELAR